MCLQRFPKTYPEKCQHFQWKPIVMRFAVALGMAFGLMAPPIQGEEQIQSAAHTPIRNDGNIVAEISVATQGDLLLVPVTIGGRKVKFALDTGAVATVLDVSVARQLGPLTPSQKNYSADFPEMFQLPEAIIDGSDLHLTGDVACLDLSGMRIASGHDIGGLIGMNFLKRHVIQVDFDRGWLRFLKPATVDLPNGTLMSRDKFNRPMLGVEFIAGRMTSMLIDTGMSAPGIGEVNQTLFNELVADYRVTIKGPAARTATVTGELIGRKGKLDRFQFGGFEHEQLGIREGTVNAVGLNYLSRYAITMDFPNDMLYLEKSNRFAAKTAFDKSGLVVLRFDGKTKVEKVHHDGPAFALGIRAGDEIIRVAGEKAEAYTMLQLRRLLARENQHVHLVVRHGHEVRECDLLLKDWQLESTNETRMH
jgi:hypothetical protein